MTTFTYCTSRLPYLPISRQHTGEKKYVITLADVTVIIHGSFTTLPKVRSGIYIISSRTTRDR